MSSMNSRVNTRDETSLEAKRELIASMIRGEGPMSYFMTNVDCHTLEHFERWLAGQFQQTMDLRLHYEAEGDPDDMLGWINGKSQAWQEAMLTFRLVMGRMKAASSEPRPKDG